MVYIDEKNFFIQKQTKPSLFKVNLLVFYVSLYCIRIIYQ